MDFYPHMCYHIRLVEANQECTMTELITELPNHIKKKQRILLVLVTIWMYLMYRAFSYNGK